MQRAESNDAARLSYRTDSGVDSGGSAECVGAAAALASLDLEAEAGGAEAGAAGGDASGEAGEATRDERAGVGPSREVFSPQIAALSRTPQPQQQTLLAENVCARVSSQYYR